jgi:hypothetical protein
MVSWVATATRSSRKARRARGLSRPAAARASGARAATPSGPPAGKAAPLPAPGQCRASRRPHLARAWCRRPAPAPRRACVACASPDRACVPALRARPPARCSDFGCKYYCDRQTLANTKSWSKTARGELYGLFRAPPSRLAPRPVCRCCRAGASAAARVQVRVLLTPLLRAAPARQPGHPAAVLDARSRGVSLLQACARRVTVARSGHRSSPGASVFIVFYSFFRHKHKQT